MFISKFLKPNQVDEVNAKGRFIKVMNCESVFRIRILSQGRALVDTDAAAGFDIQTNEPFDFIEITSDIEQKLQIWASEHKLSYDALSTKASKANSFLISHYGQSQQLTTYDPTQSKVKILSQLNFWVGGEGVSLENGLPVKAGEVYTHDSAAPISAYIDVPVSRLLSPEGAGLKATSFDAGVYKVSYIGNGLVWLSSTKKGLLELDSGVFNEFEDIRGGSKNVKFEPFIVNGKIMAVVDKTPSGVVKIVEISKSGVFLGETLTYNIGSNFNATTACTDGESIYLSGSESDGYGRVKVIKITGDNITQYETNINEGNVKLSINRLVFFNGDFFINSGNSLYVSGGLFNDCQKIISSGVILDTSMVIESEGKKVFSNSYKALVLNEDNTEFAFSTGKKLAAYFDGTSQYYMDKQGIAYSNDGGVVFRRGYSFIDGAESTFANVLIPYGDYVYSFCEYEGFLNLVAFDSVVDKSKPKAQFRVLKESF